MNKQAIQVQIHYIFSEINELIFLLYQVNDIYTKNILVNQLWDKISHLQFMTQLLAHEQVIPQPIPQPQVPKIPPTEPTPIPQKSFTIEELSTFTGKDGMPAYVAVDGIVYDVTNNAAWAAASHFGLTAGKDLSGEFQSCHSGQRGILTKLKIVGRLVS